MKDYISFIEPNIINFTGPQGEDVSVGLKHTDEFRRGTRMVIDYIRTLPLSKDDDASLIALFLVHSKYLEKVAFLQGVNTAIQMTVQNDTKIMEGSQHEN